MAKTPMITRTIQTTEVDLLCLNIIEGEPFNTTVTIPRTYKDEASMLKAAAKLVDNAEQKAVHVVGSRVKETLYGMKETDFIAHADVLPARAAKEVLYGIKETDFIAHADVLPARAAKENE